MVKIAISFGSGPDLRAAADLIQEAERLGFDSAWLQERVHNPFLSLTIAAKATSQIQLGTIQAAAFPRSPMVTAQIAWDLARQAPGRFALGLGIPPHQPSEGRSDENLSASLARMREYIESLRAIWQTFQTDARLRYRGEHYQFRLMTPFFNPGPIAQPEIPLYLAGGGPELAQLAGEVADGWHAPPFYSAAYLRDIVRPALETGLATSPQRDFRLALSVLVISGFNTAEKQEAEKYARQRIAAWASDVGFQLVLRKHTWMAEAWELTEKYVRERFTAWASKRGFQLDLRQQHNWVAEAAELEALAQAGKWQRLAQRIPPELLQKIAIIAEPADILEKIAERYSGLVDVICLELPPAHQRLLEAIAKSR